MGADDFGEFLDVKRDAWHLARVVAPALSPGWSRSKVMLTRLAAMNADNYEIVAADARAGAALLCREGDERGLHDLAHYFRASTADHPPRTGLIASFDDQAKKCRHER
jgi:hypothetical protein